MSERQGHLPPSQPSRSLYQDGSALLLPQLLLLFTFSGTKLYPASIKSVRRGGVSEGDSCTETPSDPVLSHPGGDACDKPPFHPRLVLFRVRRIVVSPAGEDIRSSLWRLMSFKFRKVDANQQQQQEDVAPKVYTCSIMTPLHPWPCRHRSSSFMYSPAHGPPCHFIEHVLRKRPTTCAMTPVYRAPEHGGSLLWLCPAPP